MRVDGDRGKPFDRRDVAQVAAEALFVDREIVVERQQHGRNDAVGNVMRVTGHFCLLGGGRLHRNRSGPYHARRAEVLCERAALS